MLIWETFSLNTTGPVGESIMERLIRLESFLLSFSLLSCSCNALPNSTHLRIFVGLHFQLLRFTLLTLLRTKPSRFFDFYFETSTGFFDRPTALRKVSS